MDTKGSKFFVKRETENGVKVFFLHGTIDEDAKFSAFEQEKGPVIFDFGAVNVINSCGVRNWVNYMKKMRGEEVFYRQCPPSIVKQLNLVPSFKANAKVLSVYVPYLCFNCDHESRLLIEMEELTRGKEIPALLKCEACGEEEMEIDGDETQFKMYG